MNVMLTNQDLYQSLLPILPAVALMLGGCILLLFGIMQENSVLPADANRSNGWAWSSLLIILMVWGVWCLASTSGLRFDTGLFRIDSVTRYGTHLTLLAGALLVIITLKMTPARYAFEFHSCLLFLLSGAIFVAGAADLTSLYLGLEVVSIPTTLLLSVSRRDDAAREATLKYFSLSAFSSAVFLMGGSYLYGIAGTTSIDGIILALAKEQNLLSQVALTMVLGGLAFRVTAVPFHFYAPDVFSGSALTVAALLSTLPKIAGFAAMIRLLGGETLSINLAANVVPTLMILALITMTLGNSLALIQKSWRRLFAYSSVAHSGYLLLGLAAALQQGIGAQAVLAYLAAYSVMTLGVFAAIATLHGSYDKDLQLSDLRGLTQKSWWIGISLSICLLSLIGIPLTAGFWAKFNIFQIAVTANDSLLLFGAVVMAINAVIGAVYYLSLLASINGWDSTKEAKPLEISFASPATVACVACAVITLLWFVFPKWM